MNRKPATEARMDAVLACLRDAHQDRGVLPNHRHFGQASRRGWAMRSLDICHEMGWGYAQYAQVLTALKHLVTDGLVARVESPEILARWVDSSGVWFVPLLGPDLLESLEAIYRLPAAGRSA